MRLRLTLVYAVLFLASGAGLLATTYVLVRHATGDVLVAKQAGGRTFLINTKKASTPDKGAPTGVLKIDSSIPGLQLTPKQIRARIRDLALTKKQVGQLRARCGVTWRSRGASTTPS